VTAGVIDAVRAGVVAGVAFAAGVAARFAVDVVAVAVPGAEVCGVVADPTRVFVVAGVAVAGLTAGFAAGLAAGVVALVTRAGGVTVQALDVAGFVVLTAVAGLATVAPTGFAT
jgi:hypothetical protein